MQVILTPTASADKFGPGLNGFEGSVPGPPTQLSAEWFDSVQQELVNVITGQGLVLDGMQFDQMKRAIDNYAFVDPTITSTLTIDNGATLNVVSGGTLQCDAGSTATFSALSTSDLATLKSCDVLNNITVGTTAVITGILSPLAGINLGGQQINGTASSIVDVDRGLFDKIELTNMGSTFSTTHGHMRLNETALMFVQSATLGDAVAIDDPQRGWDITFSTSSGIDTTTAVASRTVQQAEPVWIAISARYEGTSIGNLNLRVSVAGTPGTIDIGTTTFRIDTINVGWSLHHVMIWTPTDSFITPGTIPYSFTVRMGVSAGTLTATNVTIKVSSALEI